MRRAYLPYAAVRLRTRRLLRAAWERVTVSEQIISLNAPILAGSKNICSVRQRPIPCAHCLIPTVPADPNSGYFGRIMELADKYKTLGVRTNADTPADAKQAAAFGAHHGVKLVQVGNELFNLRNGLALSFCKGLYIFFVRRNELVKGRVLRLPYPHSTCRSQFRLLRQNYGACRQI